MNSNVIKDLLEKIPVGLLAFVYLAYIGYQYYDFRSNPSSPYVEKMKVLTDAQELNKKSNLKLKEVQEFIKHLNDKKVELRELSKTLQDVKGSLPEYLDVPKFMKTVVTEAKRVGMTIMSLSPSGSENKEYYTEQNFKMEFRTAFVQYLAFLQRIANVNDIVRIENFEMSSVGNARNKFVEISGKLEIKTYRYLASKADSLGKETDEKK